jgi:hypothetical protein
MAGYHEAEIRKGKLGESSKIQEELDELKDAENQGAKVLALVELADLVGAIDYYLKIHFPGFKFKDLQQMASLTAQAFKEGHRGS